MRMAPLSLLLVSTVLCVERSAAASRQDLSPLHEPLKGTPPGYVGAYHLDGQDQ